MSYIDDHHRRWGKLFGHEAWFEMRCALYEGPGHDWKGADVALDQVLYALAKARGLDTTQRCPSCRQIVDQPASLSTKFTSKDLGCDGCRLQAGWEDIAEMLSRAESRAAHARWRESLSPDQRLAYDLQQSAIVERCLYGLLHRDVQ